MSSPNALATAVAGLALDHEQALERRRGGLAADKLGEVENQFQVKVDGIATDVADWASFDVTFDVEFAYAPSDRDSNLIMPHVTHGAFFDTVSSAPSSDDQTVSVSAHVAVRAWRSNVDSGALTGATVAVAVTSPGNKDGTFYSGTIHLTFQGWGTPPEVSNDELDPPA